MGIEYLSNILYQFLEKVIGIQIHRHSVSMYCNWIHVQALEKNKLFILDHHDTLMPYVKRINTTSTKMYATRTILLLREDGTLTPLAIELSRPHSDGEQHGAVSKVFTPAHEGVEGSIWQLAKAYVAVNDSGYHQLISHWYGVNYFAVRMLPLQGFKRGRNQHVKPTMHWFRLWL